jgi:hypothetical protein
VAAAAAAAAVAVVLGFDFRRGRWAQRGGWREAQASL